jgi:hypothetical protein
MDCDVSGYFVHALARVFAFSVLTQRFFDHRSGAEKIILQTLN